MWFQCLWKGKDISLCAPVKTSNVAVVLAAAQPEAWGRGSRKGLGPGRQWVLQHRVAISKQWHPMKCLLMHGRQAGAGASQSEASMAGETGAVVIWKLGMSKMGQDELQELKGGKEGNTCYAEVLQCQRVQSTFATEWRR